MSLLLPLILNAKVPEAVCDNLHDLTCAPGEYEDGTGRAKTATLNNNELEKARKKILEDSKINFKQALEKPENSHFRRTALSATGLYLNPVCADADTKLNQECTELLVEGLTDFAAHNLFAAKQPEAEPTDEYFLLESPEYRAIYSNLHETYAKQNDATATAKKIREKVFPQIKKLLSERLDTAVADPTTRQMMKDKLNSITFGGTDCSSGSGKDSIAGILFPNAYFHPYETSFRYCSAMTKQSSSEFALAFSVAHELAHSIDPCGIGMGSKLNRFTYTRSKVEENDQTYPIAGLISCLRDQRSAAAATNQPKHNENSRISPYCIGDQIGESVSDWLATEVVPKFIDHNFPNLTQDQYRTGYSNVFRFACQRSMVGLPKPFMVHPSTERRVDNIVAVHPEVRKQMGCGDLPTTKVYCKVDSPSAPPNGTAPQSREGRD